MFLALLTDGFGAIGVWGPQSMRDLEQLGSGGPNPDRHDLLPLRATGAEPRLVLKCELPWAVYTLCTTSFW